METRVLKAGEGSEHPAISEAARLLRGGEVVAFPTETVYGLGANALNPAAVKKIYEAKGRPSTNPLIVHVASTDQARQLTTHWPDEAEVLARALWPGPLTLILKRRAEIPDLVSAGGDTVGLRMPRHPVALALIEKCGFPLAAPSANLSNYISPTTAAHVKKSLGGRIPMILDGGPSEGGIESTVLDLTREQPKILRPGIFSANFLEGILGKPIVLPAPAKDEMAEPVPQPLRSPGLLLTHYSPHTPFFLVKAGDLPVQLEKLSKNYPRLGLMPITAPGTWGLDYPFVEVKPMPAKAEPYARELYATLYQMDRGHLDAIICELPPDTLEWAGIQDRLRRAAR